MASEHVTAACGEASCKGPATTARISALLYPILFFVMQGKDDAYQKDFHQGTIEGRILGEDHFAEEALIKAAQKVVRQATLERVLQVVGEQYGICQADLASGRFGQWLQAESDIGAQGRCGPGNDNRKLTTCANRILTTPNMIDVQ